MLKFTAASPPRLLATGLRFFSYGTRAAWVQCEAPRVGLRLSWGGGVFDTVRNPQNNLTTPRRRKKRSPAIYMLYASAILPHDHGPRVTRTRTAVPCSYRGDSRLHGYMHATIHDRSYEYPTRGVTRTIYQRILLVCARTAVRLCVCAGSARENMHDSGSQTMKSCMGRAT